MSGLTSVVVAARNAEATLGTALDSLLAQSVSNWEAVLVDDGSTDSTRAIALSYAARDSRFSVIAGPGKGVSAARNLGLASVNGKRLLFLDSDDWIAPCFLESLGAALEKNPEAFAAYCAYQRVTPEGRLTEIRLAAELEGAPFEVMARRCGAALHCFLLNRALVAEVGGFDEGLRTCEDWDLWQRAARTGARFVAVPRPLAFYRMSPTSLTRDVRAMIADAEVVIARGFSTDNRISQPAAAHVGGADPDFGGTADRALSYFTLWCTAHEVGRGAAIDEILAARRLSDLKDEVDVAVEVIFDALYVGARCAPKELAVRWPKFEPLLRKLLDRLGTASTSADLVRRLQYKLERRILNAADIKSPTVLGLTAAARIDIRHPAGLTLPERVDRLLLTIVATDQQLGTTEIAVFAPLSSRELATVALRVVGLRTFVRESHALVRPHAWFAGLFTLARGLAQCIHVRKRRNVHALAREALRAAALAVAGPVSEMNTNGTVFEAIIAEARRDGELSASKLLRSCQ
jgi:glycosyltransferase involved in cell wall biosynthesis